MRRLVAALIFALVLLSQGMVAAQDKPVEWNFPKFSTAQYVITGSALALSLGTELLWPERTEAVWIGPILFDDATRSLLLADTLDGQELAALWSDILVFSLAAYPNIDGVFAAGLARDEWTVGSQMVLLNVQSYALSTLVIGVAKRVIGRRRPGAGRCYDEPDWSPECAKRSTKSHPSGHANAAFTGAGLACAHHLNMDLYGGGAADIAACATSLTVAATVATLRIVANKHYLSDIVVGTVVGLGFGYLLPVLAHYNQRSEENTVMQQPITPTVVNFGGTF